MNYAKADVTDVGHIDWLLIELLLLLQGIMGQYYILPFRKVCFSVPYAGDTKRSNEALSWPFREFHQLTSVHGCHLDTSRSFHSVRKRPTQKRPSEQGLRTEKGCLGGY